MISNPSLAALIVSDDVQMVSVKFPDGAARCTYKCAFPVAAGDLVVTEPNNRSPLGRVALVMAVNVKVKYDGAIDYKWLVQKVDIRSHEARLEQERMVIEMIGKVESDGYRHRLRAELLAALGGPAAAMPKINFAAPVFPEAET